MLGSLRLLRYVVAAADAGSVSAAAGRLNVSQPSVSGAIAQLEAELGVALFVRHHARGVTLTAPGHRVVAEARALLHHAQDFAQGARALGAAPQGEVAVGCFLTLAMRYMPPLLAGFRAAQPGITVRLEEGDQAAVLDGLCSGRTELALSYGYALPTEVEGELLAELPPHAIVAAGHPLAGRPAVSLRELAGEPFVLLDLPHSRDYFAAVFAACRLEPRIAYRSGSYELIRGLVGRGLGYTLHNMLPRTDVTYDGSRIAILPLSERPPPVKVMSLRLARHRPRPAVAAFAVFLREAFRPGGLLADGDAQAFPSPPAFFARGEKRTTEVNRRRRRAPAAG